jgi:hypothetical protein
LPMYHDSSIRIMFRKARQVPIRDINRSIWWWPWPQLPLRKRCERSFWRPLPFDILTVFFTVFIMSEPVYMSESDLKKLFSGK